MTSRHEQRTGTARVRPLTALSASRHQSPFGHLSQKQLLIKMDPGYKTRILKRISSFICCFIEWRRRANAKTPYSVASSGNFGVGSFPLIGHDCLLLVLSEFLLFVLGIQELIPG